MMASTICKWHFELAGFNAACHNPAVRFVELGIASFVYYRGKGKGGMKIEAVLEGILARLISAALSYSALISRATVSAIAIRRKMPDA
jgi:hypothetical protein